MIIRNAIKNITLALGLMVSLAIGQVQAAEGEVYIISPANGDVVSGPVTVLFGLKGLGVSPAGLERANTGHHHLLIDVDKLPNLKLPIPADDNHKHFGGGQTQVTVDLSPGKHTLQLLLGNHYHIPHAKPVLSEKITITVK